MYKNKNKEKEWRKEYRKNNKDKLLKREKKYREKNKVEIRNRDYLRKYRIRLEEYNKILEAQNGVCKICKLKEKSKKAENLAIDHNEKNGNVRGLLCGNCNRALGGFQDNIQNLLKAVKYLKTGEETCALILTKEAN